MQVKTPILRSSKLWKSCWNHCRTADSWQRVITSNSTSSKNCKSLFQQNVQTLKTVKAYFSKNWVFYSITILINFGIHWTLKRYQCLMEKNVKFTSLVQSDTRDRECTKLSLTKGALITIQVRTVNTLRFSKIVSITVMTPVTQI
jgi:hypothetical protein